MKLKPYEQGALDSLCGIYSIVNAMRVIRGLNNEESQELFKQIIGYLEDTRESRCNPGTGNQHNGDGEHIQGCYRRKNRPGNSFPKADRCGDQ